MQEGTSAQAAAATVAGHVTESRAETREIREAITFAIQTTKSNKKTDSSSRSTMTGTSVQMRVEKTRARVEGKDVGSRTQDARVAGIGCRESTVVCRLKW